MMTPRAGSIPPHPEIGSCDTRASPSTLPGTTVLPWRMTLPLILGSRCGQRIRTAPRLSRDGNTSAKTSVPAPGDGRVDALLEGPEPRLDAEARGQVVRLLGGIGREHPRPGRRGPRHRRAGV